MKEEDNYTTAALMYEKDSSSSVHNGTRVSFFGLFRRE
jgi:hypothetical protein